MNSNLFFWLKYLEARWYSATITELVWVGVVSPSNLPLQVGIGEFPVIVARLKFYSDPLTSGGETWVIQIRPIVVVSFTMEQNGSIVLGNHDVAVVSMQVWQRLRENHASYRAT